VFKLTRLALLAAIPAALGAQQPSVDFTPYVGLYLPTTTVISQFEPACPCDVSLKHHTAFLAGARVLYWVNDRFGLEATGAYSGSGVTATASGIGSADTSARVVLGGLRFVARLNRPRATTALLAGAGVGVVWHGGDFYDLAGATGTADVGASVMFGVRSRIGSHLAARLEFEDYLYSASFGPSPATAAQFQHDFVVSLGLSVGFGG